LKEEDKDFEESNSESNELELQGWLEIWSSSHNMWKSRFFQLKQDVLTYMKEEFEPDQNNSISHIKNLLAIQDPQWKMKKQRLTLKEHKMSGDVNVIAVEYLKVKPQVILNGKIQERCFSLCFVKRNFILRAPTAEKKNQWYINLNNNIRILRDKSQN